MKTNELTGAVLDWAVAKCEGYAPFSDGISWIIEGTGGYRQLPKYSTDWAQGGPIIEREGIDLKQWNCAWTAELEFLPDDDDHYRYGKGSGPTPLIAAMRCYVASKMGDNIEIPEGLK